MSRDFVQKHQELRIYQLAFENAMQIFELVRLFPDEEKPLLTSQLIRASRSVCANIAEGWLKRRYKGSFVAKLTDAAAEAAEMQTWLEFAVVCGYLDSELGQELHGRYNEILAGIMRLVDNADAWVSS